MTLRVPTHVAAITAALRGAGYQAYVVGGAVRDALAGREASDWDVATDAYPDTVLGLFARTVPTGLKYGTVTVLTDAGPVEVTTLRSDGTYGDGRRPDHVTFGADITEDLARRDFTVNAMAYDDGAGRLIDPFGGQADLKDKLIRTVGDPARRFGEDGLRLLRAVRFAAQLRFSLERATLVAVQQRKEWVHKASIERVRDELTKILLAGGCAAGLRQLRHAGLLGEVLPEMAPMVGFKQHNTFHKWDVWEHTVQVVAATPPVLRLRLAGLLHDVAKPCCFTLGEDGTGHFYGHEKAGAEMAETILRRLRFDNDTIAAVTHLVREHMWVAGPHMTDRALRRLLRRLGPEHVDDFCALRMADKAGSGTAYDTVDVDFLRRVAPALSEQPLSIRDLAVRGTDIIALGVPAGPQVGFILQVLLDNVLDQPELNHRDQLLTLAAEVARQAGYFS